MDATPLPATFAGHYRIERELGRGGMAAVYLARDLRQHRDVAIKVLHEELSQAVGAERFHREVAITAGLAHPNILPLHDSGEWEGRLYYVMPYVAGETLRSLLERDRQLPLRTAIGIARGVCAALEHAHARGIIHRDIKPENILISGDQPVVADFGIARLVDEVPGGRITATGVSVGTPAYMSPEQASAEPRVDERSDVYSVGCVLYEMIAGEPPFTGRTAQAIIAKRFATPAPDVRIVRDAVPECLADVVGRALARTPADRFPDAAALRAALDEAELECATLQGLASVPGMKGRRRAPPSRRLLAAAALVTIVGAGWLSARAIWPPRAAAGSPTIRTVAVLPLRGSSTGMQPDFLAEGLTDALITGISQLGSVNVISRTSVMQMSMMKKPLPELARGLKADGVIEASIVRSGSRVRISARLIRASDERELWADSYERELGDALSLQADVADAVAREIGARVGGGSLPRPRAVKPEAQEAYVKGVYFAGQWRLQEAIAAFQQAVAIDPRHASAYAALARAYYFQAFFGQIAPAEAFSQMRRAATRALALDERSAEAHGLLALVATHYDWDWEGAERHFARALALSPSNAQVHHDYAHFLLAVGRQRESVAETTRALQLDPANPMLTSCVGWHSLFDSRYDDALRYAAESQRMMPSFWAQVISGWALLGKNHPDSAVAAMRRAVSLSGGLPFAEASLAHALARARHTAESRTLLDALLAKSLRGYVPAYDLAVVHAGLGNADEAFVWLRKALGERSMFLVHLNWDARLEPLRADPRFQAIVREMALPQRQPAPVRPVT